VIKARLLLAIRLIDTTTGREIEESDVHFGTKDEELKPMNKGEGFWVFTGDNREDFSMYIKARGYDDADLDVRFDTLDPKLPMCDVFLMPSEKNRVGGTVAKIHGTLSNLKSIEAVAVERPICFYHEMSEKKGVVKLSLLPKAPGGRVVIENMRYALMYEDGTRYEAFEVTDSSNPSAVVLKDPLLGEHKANEKVFRIIYGRAGPKGAFSLKVRDDSDHLPHLIHFVAGKYEYFRPIDFHLETGEIDLLEGALKVKLPEPVKPPEVTETSGETGTLGEAKPLEQTKP